MTIVFIRTFIVYMVVLMSIRIMGKSELSKMDPFQMVVIFMIADLAAIPIESTDVSLINGISAIFALLFLQVAISFLCLKSEKMRTLFSGKPSILIGAGEVNKKEMQRLRITIDDLSEQLRLKGYPSISDVDYAILESNGDLSVIVKPDQRPLTPADLNISKEAEIVPVVLIADGILYESNLHYIGKDENYLKSQLLKVNITEYSQVFLCICDGAQKFHVYENTKAKAKESFFQNTETGGPCL
ncbi:MAG: DUF421 domain-containing protein [Anaerovorax sp.]